MTVYSTEAHYENGSTSSFRAPFYGVLFYGKIEIKYKFNMQ